MKKKTYHRKRVISRIKKRSSRRLHHRVLSFFRGDGGIYVILLLGVAMAGAFALSGGILPQLNPNPSSADEVQIDENSAKQSSESSLQLVDIKIKPTDTPTPTPTVPPSITPTPTGGLTPSPTGDACFNNTAMLLLVDLSASMGFENKITELNSALKKIKPKLRDETYVGMYAFGSYTNFSYNGVKGVEQKLPFTKYVDNKSAVNGVLGSLSEGGLGGTYTRNGVQVAIDRITAAKQNSKFNNYKFATIVFSDGVPERSGADPATDVNLGVCAPTRQTSTGPYQKCFAKEQDPRTDLTASLKTLGKVYSVVVYDQRSGEDDSYFVSPVDSQDRLRTLMKNIATKSSYYHDVEVRGVGGLSPIFESIVNGLCTD